MHGWMSTHTLTNTHTNTHVHVCTDVSTYLYIYISIYIRARARTHTHTHTHTRTIEHRGHVQRELEAQLNKMCEDVLAKQALLEQVLIYLCVRPP